MLLHLTADCLFNAAQRLQFLCWGLLIQDFRNRLDVILQGLLLLNIHGFTTPELLLTPYLPSQAPDLKR